MLQTSCKNDTLSYCSACFFHCHTLFVYCSPDAAAQATWKMLSAVIGQYLSIMASSYHAFQVGTWNKQAKGKWRETVLWSRKREQLHGSIPALVIVFCIVCVYHSQQAIDFENETTAAGNWKTLAAFTSDAFNPIPLSLKPFIHVLSMHTAPKLYLV